MQIFTGVYSGVNGGNNECQVLGVTDKTLDCCRNSPVRKEGRKERKKEGRKEGP